MLPMYARWSQAKYQNSWSAPLHCRWQLSKADTQWPLCRVRLYLTLLTPDPLIRISAIVTWGGGYFDINSADHRISHAMVGASSGEFCFMPCSTWHLKTRIIACTRLMANSTLPLLSDSPTGLLNPYLLQCNVQSHDGWFLA